MATIDKLAGINVKVPFHGPGNVIKYKEVEFDIFKVEGQYKAVPLCSYQDRVLASLPPELIFTYEQGATTSSRGNLKDGNLGVIQEIVEELKKQKAID